MKEIIGEIDFFVEIPLPNAESIDEKVNNKKIVDALALLKNRNFVSAYALVCALPTVCPASQRVKFLCEMGVANEKELSFGVSEVTSNASYQYLLENGSPDLIKTYTRLAEVIEQNKAIRTEIIEVDKLLKVKLFDDAIDYAKKMTEKYPDCCLSWARLLLAKYGKKGAEIDYLTERALFDETKKMMEKMRACPDIEYYGQTEGKYIYDPLRRYNNGNVDNAVEIGQQRYATFLYNEKKEIEKEKKRIADEKEKNDKKESTKIQIIVGICIFAFMVITSVIFQSCGI